MDIQAYFQKKRQIESSIETPYALVVSLETGDGGKAGQLTEVSRSNAAQLIVEGRARLASETELEEYAQAIARARQMAEEVHASKVQVAVLSEPEMRALKSSLRVKG